MIEGVHKLRRHAGAKETIPNIEKNKPQHVQYHFLTKKFIYTSY